MTTFSDDVRELYHELVELSPDQRERHLEARQVSPEVRAEVERLLQHTEEQADSLVSMGLADPDRAVREVADAFMRAIERGDASASSAMDELSGEARRALELLTEASRSPSSPRDVVLDERLEGWVSTVRRYNLEGEVAVGGMGRILKVWDRQLDRPLAMKVLQDPASSSGSSRSQMARRFVDEARTTGRLDHPGVVPVHEMGVDENGEAFFTMRLVKGLTLKEVFAYAAKEEGGWTQTRALESLVRACETVAYAHSHNVVHRDLKPSNIMVGKFGETYVMDWGLAKELIRDPRDDSTAWRPVDPNDVSKDPLLQTMAGDVLGTPAYMPPEQARGQVDFIGPASDVYSMGCVLYHLLAGHAPYGEKRASAAMILGEVQSGPPTPLERRCDAPAELVAICERAMSRNVDDRYPDMGAMRDDLRAYLEGHVVQAHRTGAVVEFRKWVSRNRGLAVASGLALLLALGGLGTISYVQAQANQDLSEARNATLAANADLQEANDNLGRVTGFQSQQLAGVDVSVMGQGIRSTLLEGVPEDRRDEMSELLSFVNFTDVARDALRTDILEPSLRSIDTEFADQTVVQAQLLQTVADSAQSLGLYSMAREPQRRALELRRSALGDDAPETVDSQKSTGILLESLGEYELAEASFRAALERRIEAEGELSTGALYLRIQLGVALMRQARFEEAAEEIEWVVEKARETYGSDHHRTMDALVSLGVLNSRRGRHTESLACYEEAAERMSRVLGPDHSSTMNARSNMATALVEMGRIDEAEALQRELLVEQRRYYGNSHPTTMLALDRLAETLTIRGEYTEARKFREEALETAWRMLGRDHPQALLQANNTASIIADMGEYEEAELMYRDVYEGCLRVLGERHVRTLAAKGNLASVLWDLSRTEEAETLRRESVELMRQMDEMADNPMLYTAIANYATILMGTGRAAEAEPYLWEALEGRRRLLGDDHASTCNSYYNLGEVFLLLNRFDEAEEYTRMALDGYRARLGDSAMGTLYSLENLGKILMKKDRAEEAEPLFREAFEGWKAALGLESGLADRLLDEWIRCIRTLRQYEDAEELLFELWDEAELASEDPNVETEYQQQLRRYLVAVYQGWHRYEPDAGYDEKAELWK